MDNDNGAVKNQSIISTYLSEEWFTEDIYEECHI